MTLEITMEEVIAHFATLHNVSKDSVRIVDGSDAVFVERQVKNCINYNLRGDKIGAIKELRYKEFTRDELSKFERYARANHYGEKSFDFLAVDGSHLGLAASKWFVERFGKF